MLLDSIEDDGRTLKSNCLWLKSSTGQTDNHIENPRMHKTYEYDQNQSQEGLPKYNLA
jgi:hypothetical protein